MELLKKLQEWRGQIEPPDHIQMTAELIWSRYDREQEYLRTNCELTTYAIRDYLTPGCAYDDEIWVSQTTLPKDAKCFEVIFGEFGIEDHYMIIINGFVYQSFAFVKELFAMEYDPQIPFWRYVPVENKTDWKKKPLHFLVK